MVDYTRMTATAKRLIEKNGRTVTLRHKVEADADGDRPWAETTGKSVEADAVGVFLDYTLAEIDGELIRRGDQKVLFAATSEELEGTHVEDFDEVDDGGVIWKIQGVEPLCPGDTCLMYTMQVRR